MSTENLTPVTARTPIHPSVLLKNDFAVKSPSFTLASMINEKLTLEAFHQLAGVMAGIPFVKIVVNRPKGEIHFINNSKYKFHSDYIAEQILNVPAAQVDANLDEFNKTVYLSPESERKYYLGTLGLSRRLDKKFFTLEVVEADNMNESMLQFFYDYVKSSISPAIPLFFKPASHDHETRVKQMDPTVLPYVFNYELFNQSEYIPLNAGVAKGRVRIFKNEIEYKHAKSTIEWYDILVMPRVPDDIPRVSGIINANHTTPLSHTNVLATGWQIPNSIHLGIINKLEQLELDSQWVKYSVDMNSLAIELERIEKPADLTQRPSWSTQNINIEAPEVENTPILELRYLRMSDRFRYGTKAANLGELCHILDSGSERILGFYKVRRPPRANLLPYIAKHIGISEKADIRDINRAACDFLRSRIQIPRGIAIPFAIQVKVLERSAKVQQCIGKLKMALELNSREIDALCLQLQQLIQNIRIPDDIRDYIDTEIANHLCGVSSFVVRSSSNAEDLEGFSAAGMYESIIHVTTAEKLFQAIKEVWASLISPRSVRLQNQVGISLDDCYMGVIVQEEMTSDLGGVMVTTNPMNRADFRNIYINASVKSVTNVVSGSEMPYQFLYNTVEGGGRTISIGDATQDIPVEKKNILQDLAIVGRLLQSHFSQDYTFSGPIDVEWVTGKDGINPQEISIVQLRPYSK